jgi:hypothetical protein
MADMFGISHNCVLAVPAWNHYTVDPLRLATFRSLRRWLEKQHNDELCDCDWREQNSDGSCNKAEHSWWTGRGGNWAYNHGCDQIHVWGQTLRAEVTAIMESGDPYAMFAALDADLDVMLAQAERDCCGE